MPLLYLFSASCRCCKWLTMFVFRKTKMKDDFISITDENAVIVAIVAFSHFYGASHWALAVSFCTQKWGKFTWTTEPVRHEFNCLSLAFQNERVSLCRYVTTMSWSVWWQSLWNCRRSSESLTSAHPGRFSPLTESPKSPLPNLKQVTRPLRRNDLLLFCLQPADTHTHTYVCLFLSFRDSQPLRNHLKYLCKYKYQ